MSDTAEQILNSVDEAERPWIQLARLAEVGSADLLLEYVETLSTTDRALALSRLDEAHRIQVLEGLAPEDAADLIGDLSEAQAARVIELLNPDSAAAIVHELPSDEQADVLGDLSDHHAAAILDAMPDDEAESARALSAYDDDVAGGMMVLEMLRFTGDMTVADVIEELNRNSETYSDFDVRYAYVCDESGTLLGVLPMQNLLFVKRSARLTDLMISNPLSVRVDTSLDDLIEFFDDHQFVGVPVVDDLGRLKGVVHREAVSYEETRAAESDYLKSQGIVGGEELRTMPLWLRARRRLSWLSINIVLNIGAAAVIAYFQDTLQAVIALAVFLPIISDMSGCSGNQAVAVSMRELSLGLVRPNELFRVWWKEVSVGLINGAVLGFLVALVAVIFDGNIYLGLVVGLALFANTVIAVSIGGVVPLALKRFGFDPAVAAGPLLTTVTDMCGFFLVLGLATIWLSRLV
ncbi:magnesium transporter [Rubripirellula reticaptiva]|uniref:Magnesium transporter MgtE n=1 Tax=Rubripirellula reticaptiva TaxID=2528013 RepID=A0A5C6EI97_9BACT|nr:magnesium transporter [Rubripirellula reticaptiva]TWU46979.1 Magnesium transporter MgtE [Rubripirellula reticaptiva]